MDDIKRLLLVVIFFLFVIWTNTLKCNAAESDSLYFTSATDMIQKVDSIEAVCDTVWVWKSNIWFLKDSSEVAQTGSVFHVPSDSEAKAKDLKIPIITCRELIDVNITIPLSFTRIKTIMTVLCPFNTPNSKTIPGQMVVWWREVER